ncbi:flagellar assembly protein FliH [Motiliproteus coralliicola]|uniref:flagellar assembly protein FliH n=1 Tax=Motiliproteus coralliicola TaxID=2283196 RepID=UPI0014022ACF|nr:flagellar assembly protein FliH [Motiliproteus coralliicola]
MTNKKTSTGRIPAAELRALKTWDFPRVGGQHVVRSPFTDKQADPAAPPPDRPISSAPLTVAEMEKLREQARQDGLAEGLAQGRQQGHAEGLESGRSEGYQAAYQQAEAEISALKGRLASAIAELQKPMEAQLEGLDQALMRLVVDTAEAVVRRELKTRPELLRQAIAESLDALPQQAQQLCFFVHPDDEALLIEVREQERANWEVAVDPALSPGGLRVRGECSYLDYSVEARFSQVVEQVLGAAEAGDDDADPAG